MAESPALSGVDRVSCEAPARPDPGERPFPPSEGSQHTWQSPPSIPFSPHDLLFGVLGEAPK